MRPACSLGVAMGMGVLCAAGAADAALVQFFDGSQVATPVASGVTSDTVSCHGYLFTYTRDKLFTGGLGGGPIGRAVRVPWPQGVEAQAVTTPPPGVTDNKARITIRRLDGDVFDLPAFSAKLLANTYGAGGSIEVMPLLDGEDGLADPAMFSATGFAGQTFSYDESSPVWVGSTAALKGFDAYKFGLYVDFALTALTFDGAPLPEPGDADGNGLIDAADYYLTDRGYATGLAGYGNGDFSEDGRIDVADYLILDAAFLWRSGTGAAALAWQVPRPVPEPGAPATAVLAASAFLRRRRLDGRR